MEDKEGFVRAVSAALAEFGAAGTTDCARDRSPTSGAATRSSSMSTARRCA